MRLKIFATAAASAVILIGMTAAPAQANHTWGGYHWNTSDGVARLTIYSSFTPDRAGNLAAANKVLAGIVINAKFSSTLMTMNWADVPNAAYYKVGLWEGSFIGPIYGRQKVNASTFSKALTNMPVDSAGVRIVVDAFNANDRVIAGSEEVLRVNKDGTKIDTDDSNAALDKLKHCARQSEVAVVGTAVGAITIAAVTVWIPGVDVVTAGGAAAAIAAAGAGTFAACVVLD